MKSPEAVPAERSCTATLERLLMHPLSLLALALWALNDHYLKTAWGNAFTGKLSDVASLVFAPVLLALASAWLGLARTSTLRLLAFWALTLALVMVSIRISAPCAWAYRCGLGILQWPFRSLLALHWEPLVPVRLAMDPSDAFTVPAALVPLVLLRRSERAPPRASQT